MKNYILSC
eukprot:gene19808-25752_t